MSRLRDDPWTYQQWMAPRSRGDAFLRLCAAGACGGFLWLLALVPKESRTSPQGTRLPDGTSGAVTLIVLGYLAALCVCLAWLGLRAARRAPGGRFDWPLVELRIFMPHGLRAAATDLGLHPTLTVAAIAVLSVSGAIALILDQLA